MSNKYKNNNHIVKVLCSVDMPRWAKQKLTTSLEGRAEICYSDDINLIDVSKDLSTFEILICMRVTSDILRSMANLQLIQLWSSGTNLINLEEVWAKGITVCNTSGAMANAVSEYVILHILTWERNLIQSNIIAQSGNWTWRKRNNLIFSELSEKTIGIVGFGNIGIQVAKRAKTFGMKVYAIRRDITKTEKEAKLLTDFLGKPHNLDYLLSRSDYVVLSLPLTQDTLYLIDKNKLDKMKKGAIIINVSRGNIVDEAVLCDYLGRGLIAGASLDVLEQEPLPNQNPFSHLNNVILSCHHAGYTRQALEKKIAIVSHNIDSLPRKSKLINIVTLCNDV